MTPEFDAFSSRLRPVAAPADLEEPDFRPATPPAPGVEHWLRRPAAWSPSICPDERAVAYVCDASGVPALWIAPVPPSGAPAGPARLVDTGPAHVREVSYSPDGRWIALEIAPGGGEHTQVYLVRPDGSGGRVLAGDGPAAGAGAGLGVEIDGAAQGAATLGRWTGDGARLAVGVARLDGSVDGFLVEPDTGRRIFVASGVALTVCDVSRDGRHALVRRGPRGRREVVLVALDAPFERVLAAGEPPAATPAPARSGRGAQRDVTTGTVGFGRFFVDGHTAYLQTDAGRERIALLAVRLPERGGPRSCGVDDTADPGWSEIQVLAERDDADLERFTLVPDGRTVALAWNADGRTELELLDLGTLERRPLPAPPHDVVTSMLATSDARWLILALEGPVAPSRLWTYEVTPETGAAARPAGYRSLLAPPPNRGTRTLAAVPDGDPAPGPPAVRPTLERLRSHDGLGLSGWLYRPAASPGPGPTVIHLHGGPEAEERPTYNPLFQALVAAGVTVFAPNVRGSSGFGRSFLERDDLSGRFDAIADVAACAQYLAGAGVAEAGRVGVMGRSYGGYLTLASLVEFPELFAVGVDICGMVDLETFYTRTEPWIAAAAVTKYGDPTRDRDLLAALSPIHRFDRLAAPLLVVHGANDTNVPLFEAEQTVAAASAVGVPVRFLLFDDEGHEARGTANRALFVRTVVDWLVDYLSPVRFRNAV